MVVSELHKTLEKRHGELVSLLHAESTTLPIEKQHQIYGAINELKLVMQSLSYYRNQEIIEGEKESDFSLFRDTRKSVFSNAPGKQPDLLAGIKGLFSNFRK